MKKLGAVVLITALVLQLFSINIFADEEGDTYFVSPDGSDIATAGTFENPFKTISYAGNFLKPGDTCYIREGVYRETVTPANNGTADNPITYEAYMDEKVVISGCDLVTDWVKHQGNIYKASMDWDISNGEGNIVFVNEQLGFEGRWPNNQNDILDNSTYPVMSSAGSTTIDSSYSKVIVSGTNIPIVEAGTKFWCVADPGYNSITGVVMETTTKTSIAIKTKNTSQPVTGDIYALIGSLALVDIQGEWYKDRDNQLLYVYSDVNPNTIEIEAKKRNYGIDLSDRKNIIFNKVDLRATSIKTNDNTTNCTYKQGVVDTVGRKMVEIGTPSSDGIEINGTYNTIIGCEIKNCYGMAIKLNGSYNRVVNNWIHDTNFEGSNCRAVWINGSNQLVSHNTISDTGRFATGGTFTDSVISYNDMYNTEGITKDGGVLYLNDNDYGKSEIHHNYIHDNLDPNGPSQYGLYFDTGTCSLLVYNNIIWNIDHLKPQSPLCASTHSDYCIYFNNTIINHNTGMGHYPADTSELNGGTYINNLFARTGHEEGYPASKGWTYINNIEDGRDTGCIVDGDYYDFSLQEGCKAINAGTYIPGISEGYVGSKPDIGAREFGAEKWVAGHDFSKMEQYDEPFILNLQLPFRNMLENREFEFGLEGWDTLSGSPSLMNQSSWKYSFSPDACTKNGYYALMLKAGDVVNQRLEGLKPNTQYVMNCYSRTSGKFVDYTNYQEVSGTMSTNTGGLECQNGNSAWAKFTVDFDKGQFDTFKLVVHNVQTPLAYCSLRLNSVDGDELGGAYLERQEGLQNNLNYYDITFSRNLTGENVVYFVFDDGGTGKLKNTKLTGFELFDKDSADKAQFKITSDTGAVTSLERTENWYNIEAEKLYFTTGQAGYADITISHLGGNNVIYFDALGIQEVYTGEIASQPVLLKSVNILDLEGNAVTSVKDNSLNIVGLTFENHTNQEMTVVGTVTSYTAIGEKGEVASIDTPISANRTETLGLGITIADSKGYLVLEFTLGEDEVFEYNIPVWRLSNGMNADVLLKGLVIKDETDSVVTDLVKNQINNLTVSVHNYSASSINCTGYIAIYEYEDGVPRLIYIKSIIDTIESGSDTMDISITVPDATGDISATLLLWKNDGSLQPITEVYKFK